MKKLMPLEKFVDTMNIAIGQAEGKTISHSGCWTSLEKWKNGAQVISVSCANSQDLKPIKNIMEALMRTLYGDYVTFDIEVSSSIVEHKVYAVCGTYFYRDATIEYNFDTYEFMINYFGESYKTLKEAQKGVDEWIKEGIDFTQPLPEDINDCGTKVKDSTEDYWKMVQKEYDLTDEEMSKLAKGYIELRKMIVEAIKFAQANDLIAYAPAGTCDCLYEFKENVKDFAFATRDFIK